MNLEAIQSHQVGVISLAKVIQETQLVKQIQKELNRLGCAAGIEDGIWGDNTAQAWTRACNAFHMPRDPLGPSMAGFLLTAKQLPGQPDLDGLITTEQAAELLEVPLANIQTYLPKVISALQARGILSNASLIATLATIRVETGIFKPIYEQGSRNYFIKNYGSRSDLGNVTDEDGFTYRGRGFIQITGKANYAHYGQVLRVNLVNNPDLALDPTISAEILAQYFYERKVDVYAENGNWRQARIAVNGGLNGWDEFIYFVNRLQPVMV
jgi:peptidoglycan hydrolase-like protein with peptidoglycan-binding domain